MWDKFHSYDPEKGRLFTWMLNIARNLAIDKLRSKEFDIPLGTVKTRLRSALVKLRKLLTELSAVLLLKGLDEFREHLGGELTITLLQGIGHGIETHEMDHQLILQAIEKVKEFQNEVLPA